jgi:hypothetical protein
MDALSVEKGEKFLFWPIVSVRLSIYRSYFECRSYFDESDA